MRKLRAWGLLALLIAVVFGVGLAVFNLIGTGPFAFLGAVAAMFVVVAVGFVAAVLYWIHRNGLGPH